jgi:hypothetical protein
MVSAGHAFIQNIRRGHYELGVGEPTALRVAAFTELAGPGDLTNWNQRPRFALAAHNATFHSKSDSKTLSRDHALPGRQVEVAVRLRPAVR